MKSKFFFTGMALLIVLCSVSFAQVPQLINYQGKLTNASGAPLNGNYQMIFTIYDADVGGNVLWADTQVAVTVDKGVFNVLLGSVHSIPYSIFDGSIRYLGVKVGGDPEITPRKPIVSVAYAYKSFEADTADFARGFSGTVDNADKVDGIHASSTPTAGYLYPLDGSAKIPNARLYTGSGNGLDADLLDGQHASDFLTTANDYGRSGVAADLYEGTSTLTSKYVNEGQANSVTSGMIIDNTIVRADVATNFKSPYSDTADYALASAPDSDWTFRITDTADTTLITGGAWGIARYGNVLYGNKDSTHVNLGVACTTGTDGWDFSHSTVGGGLGNTASGGYATISGGWRNTANNGSATVGGGHHNVAGNGTATVGGGAYNTATGGAASIGGGESNNASGSDATLGGGESNTASGDHAMVGGGYTNTASALYATVSGGSNNIASDTNATVGGGYSNTASDGYATIGGGWRNTAGNGAATVGGGELNNASGVDATIAGGGANIASGWGATIPGGYGNTVDANYSFAAGRDVSIASGADNTFAFGRAFSTSTANAVIFYNSIIPSNPIRVGIGTTSPTTTLHVQGDALVKSTGGSVSLSGGDGCLEVWGTDGAYIDLKDSESDDYDFRITQVGGTSNLGLLGGNVGIGHTSPTEKLDVNGSARLRSMSTGTGTDVVVDANGVLLKKSSSIRYKQNIRRLDSTPDQILQLNPVRFDWKTTGETDIGLIAEEVEKAVPDLVIYDQEGKPDAVKYDKMTVYLLQVVKAQQEQIDVLKAKLEKLESDR